MTCNCRGGPNCCGNGWNGWVGRIELPELPEIPTFTFPEFPAFPDFPELSIPTMHDCVQLPSVGAPPVNENK